MRILIEFGLKSHIRHFESVLQEIKRRGHELDQSHCFKDEDLKIQEKTKRDENCHIIYIGQ